MSKSETELNHQVELQDNRVHRQEDKEKIRKLQERQRDAGRHSVAGEKLQLEILKAKADMASHPTRKNARKSS